MQNSISLPWDVRQEKLSEILHKSPQFNWELYALNTTE